MQASLRKVVEGQHLSRAEAASVMEQIMEGKVTPSQAGAFLTAMHMKGETVEEITGFAQVMRERVLPVRHPFPEAVDTCGTGGDGGKTFNVSTATAFLAAGMGVPVAKHGNRSVSSKSGSADALEALGIAVQMTAQEAEEALNHIGICFLFAPYYHQSMRHVASVRKELGFRTCFNLLGPLTNPAGVKYQLLGVYRQTLTEPLAHVLNALGTRRALIVASDDGLDEISISAPTQVSELKDGHVHTYKVTPADFGLATSALSEVAGGNAAYNAGIIRDVLSGKRGAPRDIIVANTAAVLYVTGKADSFLEGAEMASRALDDGVGEHKLEEMVVYTGGERFVS